MEYSKRVGKFRVRFTVPLNTIKTVKCWFCEETGDVNWVSNHLTKYYFTDHFKDKRENIFIGRNSTNGFDVIEKVDNEVFAFNS